MSERNRPVPESELLDELRFDSARAAPPGAALRVRQRMNRTIADGDAKSPEISAPHRVVASPTRRRTTFLRSASIMAAAIFLAGGVGAAIHAVIAPRIRLQSTPAVLPAPESRGTPKRTHAAASHAAAEPPAAEEPVAEKSVGQPVTAEPIATATPTMDRVPVAKLTKANLAPAAAVKATADLSATTASAPSVDAPSSSSFFLKAERALLDRARSSWATRQYADAEQALDRHAQQFPSGQLAEEREALAVRTLAADGQMAAARDRAARFRQRFPHSLFASAVERAVGAIP